MRPDLRAAAVNDDRIDAAMLQQHDVLGEVVRQLLVAHGVAAIFDDEGLALIFFQVGQRIDQRARGAQPLLGLGDAAVGHTCAAVGEWRRVSGGWVRLQGGGEGRKLGPQHIHTLAGFARWSR